MATTGTISFSAPSSPPVAPATHSSILAVSELAESSQQVRFDGEDVGGTAPLPVLPAVESLLRGPAPESGEGPPAPDWVGLKSNTTVNTIFEEALLAQSPSELPSLFPQGMSTRFSTPAQEATNLVPESGFEQIPETGIEPLQEKGAGDGPTVPMSGAESFSGGKSLTLTATVRDFRDRYYQKAPDIETYHLDSTGHIDFNNRDRQGTNTDGLLAPTLGTDGVPVYVGPEYSSLPPGKIAGGIDGATSFGQWYRDVPGVNKTTTEPFTFTWSNPTWGWEYTPDQFFPIDGELYGNSSTAIGTSEPARSQWHNFGFTTELRARFEYQPGKLMYVTGDDDLWVYLNGKLIVDEGGLHPPASGFVYIDNVAAAAGMVPGGDYEFALFHAERLPGGSTLRIHTSLDLRPVTPMGFVSGRVFQDPNWSGTFDAATETGFNGIGLTLQTPTGTSIASTTTAADGTYTFTNVPVGDYVVVETQPSGYASTTANRVSLYVPAAGRTGIDFGETKHEATGWTFGESGGTATGKGTVAFAGDGSFTLTEGDSFTVWAERAFVGGPGVQSATIRLTDLGFDRTDAFGMNDAFEVAVVGFDGKPLSDTFVRPGRDAQANFTEADALPAGGGDPIAAQGSGTKLTTTTPTFPSGKTNITTGAVSIDLSAVPAGTDARLRVRLVSNDADNGTTIRITGVDLNTPAGTDAGAFTPKFFVADALAGGSYQYGADGGYLRKTSLPTTATPKGIASNKLGTRQWVIDATGTVRQYDPTGYEIGSWQATGLDGVEDLTTDGTDLWAVDRTAGMIRRYAGAADRTTGSQAPDAGTSFALVAANTDATGLVTDGSKIWVTDRTARKVFAYTLAGVTVGDWSYPAEWSAITGVTLDPSNATNHLWLVDRATDAVYRIADGRAKTNGSHAAAETFALAGGNQAPEGIADPPVGLADNYGKEFWLTFATNHPMIYEGKYQHYNATRKLQLFISSETAATGNVTIAGIGFSKSFAVGPHQVATIDIDLQADLWTTSDLVTNKGIHVTADTEVAVYGLSHVRATTDAFLAIPTDVLGTEYITLGYENANHGFTNEIPYIGTQFAIVGTKDATTVTITPSETTGARAKGVPYTIVLNRGQTYQLRNTDFDTDLTGTRIDADQPISVFSGNSMAFVPAGYAAGDHLVEQNTPLHTWGTKFASVQLDQPYDYKIIHTDKPHWIPDADTFRFIASEDNTVITVNGKTLPEWKLELPPVLNSGEFAELFLPVHADIQSNRPINVAQFSNGHKYDGAIADPFMMYLAPVEQYLNNYTITTPSSGFNFHRLNVTAKAADIGMVLLNGTPIPASQFKPIGPTGTWYGAQVQVNVGSYTLEGPNPFGLVVYGFELYDSYGYVGGLAFKNLTPVAAVSLTPAAATVPVHGSHRLVARVTGAAGQPLQGQTVTFTVAGTHSTVTGSAFTDMSGQAMFEYAGTIAGTDTVTANAGGPTATATINWVVAPLAIEIISPTNGSPYPSGSTVLVTGIATPTLPTLPVAGVTVNGQPVDSLDASGRFFTRVTVPATGAATFQFIATDVYGQTASTTLTLNRTELEPDAIDFNTLLDATRVRPRFHRTSLDDSSKTFFTDVSLRNEGQYALDTPLIVVLDDLSDPTVRPTNHDGLTPQGKPFWNYSSLVAGRTLAVNGTTGTQTLSFENPFRRRFDYSLTVMGRPNRAPEFTSAPTIEVVLGNTYRYQSAATDPDGDAVDYRLPMRPSGMNFVAGKAGLIEWTPTALGNHVVRVLADDKRGGIATQEFTLQVVPVGDNRPPAFQTAPIVTAYVNAPYSYAANATDADGDPVIYSLIGSGPSVGATTGIVSWTPAPDDVGMYPLVLTANDGQGGIAEQNYTLRVVPEPGNHAPRITSQPVTKLPNDRPYQYQVAAVDGDGDPLKYSVVAPVPPNLTIDATTGLLEWSPSQTAVAVTVRVTDGRGGSDKQTFQLTHIYPDSEAS
ncbi:MAG: fibro-slime domain-containing protein, partial [Gemmataceae bacterium]